MMVVVVLTMGSPESLETGGLKFKASMRRVSNGFRGDIQVHGGTFRGIQVLLLT